MAVRYLLLFEICLCAIVVVVNCQRATDLPKLVDFKSNHRSNPVVSRSYQPFHRETIQRSREPIRRQTVRLETVRHEPVRKQLHRESGATVHREAIPIQPVRPVRRESIAKQPDVRETIQPIRRESISRQPVRERVRDPVHRDPVRRDPVHREPVRRDPVRRDPVRRDPVHREPVRRDPVRREPVNREPVRREPVNREPVRREPVHREPVRREPVHRDTVRRESVHHVTVRRDPIHRDTVRREYGNRELEERRDPQAPARASVLLSNKGLTDALVDELTTTPLPNIATTTTARVYPTNPPLLIDESGTSNEITSDEVGETGAEVDNSVNRRRDQSPIQTAIDYTKYKPRKKNLREKRLLRLLADDYDPDWMSFERPKELSLIQPSGIAYKTDANLLMSLNKLNFSFQAPGGKSFLPPPQLLNVFKDWLIRKAACPVQFTWHDIGDYYWPRWVKRGECMNDTPCSWPPGQRCVPVRSHTVFILRWHCRRTLPRYLRRGRRFHAYRYRDSVRRSRSSRRSLAESSLQAESRPFPSTSVTSRIKCRWLKIPYPVIANCFCTCP